MNISKEKYNQIISIIESSVNDTDASILHAKMFKLSELLKAPECQNVCIKDNDAELPLFIEGSEDDSECKPLQEEYIKKCIEKRYLYFDFSDEREEDMRECEEYGEEWNDDYSYNLVEEIIPDDQSEFGMNQEGYYILIGDDVDFLRFNIEEVKYISPTVIGLIDRGLYDGELRKVALRITEQ